MTKAGAFQLPLVSVYLLEYPRSTVLHALDGITDTAAALQTIL